MKNSSHQLDLFNGPKTENDVLWEAIAEIKESLRKVTKKTFCDLEEIRCSIIESKAQEEKLLALLSQAKEQPVQDIMN